MSNQPTAQAKATEAKNQVLSHPYVQRGIKIGQDNYNELDKVLARYPILNDLEARTKVPKTGGLLGLVASFIILIFFNFLNLASPVSNLIGWALPAYLSCKALESPGKDDDKQWLTYWVVFGLLNFLESAAIRPILYWFPFYFVTKTMVTIWLMLPQTRGAVKLYAVIVGPMFAKFQSIVAPGGASSTPVGSGFKKGPTSAPTFPTATTGYASGTSTTTTYE